MKDWQSPPSLGAIPVGGWLFWWLRPIFDVIDASRHVELQRPPVSEIWPNLRLCEIREARKGVPENKLSQDSPESQANLWPFGMIIFLETPNVKLVITRTLPRA